ncbi:hypothetical protein J4482_01385 [Candidatus Woesearchaeota archaeon]|nr:hypothetical protein [uncultured archaeon]MBS3115261.1 hypothetical protein [Candidatus Woesearchaeota archaeon]
MKLKINKNIERSLLSRNRIYAEVEFDAAVPPRKDIIQKLAELLSVEPDLIVVKKIEPSFGSKKASIAAYVYKNKEERDRIEERKKLTRIGFNIPKIEKKVVAAQ